MKDELLRLAERCEQAEGPDREIDVEIARTMRVTVWLRNVEDTANYETTYWRYTSSIDGALSLVPEGAFWRVGHDGEGPDPSMFRADVLHTPGSGHHIARAATPSLALCVAALKARASMEKTDGN